MIFTTSSKVIGTYEEAEEEGDMINGKKRKYITTSIRHYFHVSFFFCYFNVK